ncbi:MAG TPA: DsrE family protein [Chitinophagaceae bacterium]|nr:DsrE family protein [Chitinophagaceae bacterium]
MKKLSLLLLIIPATAILNAQARINPIIKSYGTVFQLPDADHKPDPSIAYKIIVELTENASKPDTLNEYLEALATLINLHAAEGVAKENIQMVVILRKMATYAVFGNELYKEKFKTDNPNLQLLKELSDAGVEFYVCGQTMLKRNIDTKKLVPGTKIASAGLTAITTYQLKGYTMVKF